MYPSGRSGEEITTKQAEALLILYRKTLDELGYDPIPYHDLNSRLTGNIYGPHKFEALCHARWMCDETDRFIREGRFAKSYRWIGMIQGLLFMGGAFSIMELKAHNRPTQ
jgi:hypothetical protein